MTNVSFPLDGAMATPQLLSIEAVQKMLGRSRASVYRYANTDPHLLNPPYDPKRLNPEYRDHKDEALVFHPNEVARFAQDVLGQQVTIAFQPDPQTVTEELLRAILVELQALHQTVRSQLDQSSS